MWENCSWTGGSGCSPITTSWWNGTCKMFKSHIHPWTQWDAIAKEKLRKQNTYSRGGFALFSNTCQFLSRTSVLNIWEDVSCGRKSFKNFVQTLQLQKHKIMHKFTLHIAHARVTCTQVTCTLWHVCHWQAAGACRRDTYHVTCGVHTTLAWHGARNT